MKTLRSYSAPDLKQVQDLCAAVCKALLLPDKILTDFLIDHPNVIVRKLQGLCYRPAMVRGGENLTDGNVLEKLAQDGLVDYTRQLPKVDLEIIGCFSPAAVEKARQRAALGIVTIAKVIKKDSHLFDEVPNIFVFTGNQHSDEEVETYVRAVLFQVRERFYCGPPK